MSDGPVGLHCPRCGQPPQILVGDAQAFCGNDACAVFTWNPKLTASELEADMSEINLSSPARPAASPTSGLTPGPGNELWVQSEVASDDTYVVGLHAGGDRAWVLTRDEALRHAMAVITEAERAEYDAAIITLLHSNSLGIALADAAAFVADAIRPDRPPVDNPGPLQLIPGVSQRDGLHGFLTLHLDGTAIGQWEIADARQHVLFVLQAVAAVDNDAGLYRALIAAIGIDEPVARTIVADIANHRRGD